MWSSVWADDSEISVYPWIIMKNKNRAKTAKSTTTTEAAIKNGRRKRHFYVKKS